jgi:hypothetical protein
MNNADAVRARVIRPILQAMKGEEDVFNRYFSAFARFGAVNFEQGTGTMLRVHPTDPAEDEAIREMSKGQVIEEYFAERGILPENAVYFGDEFQTKDELGPNFPSYSGFDRTTLGVAGLARVDVSNRGYNTFPQGLFRHTEWRGPQAAQRWLQELWSRFLTSNSTPTSRVASILGDRYAGFAFLWEWLYRIPVVNVVLQQILSRFGLAEKTGWKLQLVSLVSGAAVVSAFFLGGWVFALAAGMLWLQAILVSVLTATVWVWMVSSGKIFGQAHLDRTAEEKEFLSGIGIALTLFSLVPVLLFLLGVPLPTLGMPVQFDTLSKAAGLRGAAWAGR